MLLTLEASTDLIQVTSSIAADLDIVAQYIRYSDATPPVPMTLARPQLTAMTTATTTTVLAGPTGTGDDDRRSLKVLNICNKDSADSTVVTVIYDNNGTDYTLFKTTLDPGETLQWDEAHGWFVYETVSRLNKLLVTTGDVINATTSWADVTGLTQAIESGKTYNFLAHLYHLTNATTTGARFGVNGPAATLIRGSGIGTVTGSVTASVHSAPIAAVTAVDTAMNGAQTTGPATEVLAIISGVYLPSAAGTFAIRCQSEVAVAAGLTVRRGSWCVLREADNS